MKLDTSVQSRSRISPPLVPDRLDVLVHLLALEQAAGRGQVDIDLSATTLPTNSWLDAEPQRSASASAHFSQAHSTDWVKHSETFSRLDGEPDVLDRLLVASSSDVELVAKFGHGGNLVGGTVDIAVAMYLNRPVEREHSTIVGVDRSVDGLQLLGWSRGDLRGLLHKWAQVDPKSAVVILDAAHIGFDQLVHELSCRFEVAHSEVDFISRLDQKELQLTRVGTAQTLLLQATRPLLGNVLRSHDGVALGSFASDFSLVALSVLWSPTRSLVPDVAHEQRLRKIRLRGMKSQAIDRLVQRSS